MQVVAGLSLKNLKPSVWDSTSPYHLPDLKAVMVSYADFNQMPARRRSATEQGLRASLGIPEGTAIYLDNGAFFFLSKGSGEVPRDDYEEFVCKAKPDWYTIPQDYIPAPQMTDAEQLECLRRTMEVNQACSQDGYVPIVHISHYLDEYLRQFQADQRLTSKPFVGLGGIVPNLLRAPQAMPYQQILNHLLEARTQLPDQQLHVFGVGGTATVHLAALLHFDSVDSSGWRNRAARGIVQLPGRGDRTTADLGNWHGRKPDEEEWQLLTRCQCPACQQFSLNGLKATALHGFCCRATHNLWTLLEEARQIKAHLDAGTYGGWYVEHVDNSIYRPLIDYVLAGR